MAYVLTKQINFAIDYTNISINNEKLKLYYQIL